MGRLIRIAGQLIILGLVFAGGGLALIYSYVKDDLPSVKVLKDVQLQIPMRIFSADGLLISQYGLKKRIPLTFEELPIQLKQALIATEDSRFYQHPGVDPIGIGRAFVNLIATGQKGQGGSTLTMQLARKFFLTAEKKYIRKVREIFIALHIEGLLSKDEIITLYLNKMELGHRSFGVGAAAQVYYGKSIHQLTLAQIATLAGLYKAPSDLNPITNPEKSKQRRRVVLARMLDEKYITRAQFDEAANAPVTAQRHGAKIELDAPYIADMIYREMVDMYGKEVAETQGFNVYATITSDMQRFAQNAVRDNLHDYDERHGYKGPIAYLWGAPQEDEDIPQVAPIESELITTDAIVSDNTLSEPWPLEKIVEHLSSQPEYAPLEVAVVIKVDNNTITVVNKKGQTVVIDWNGLAWARPFLDDSHQGPAPETAAEILSAGALIYTRFNPTLNAYQLSQFPEASSAFVALNPNNGSIQAIVGGYSFQQSQFNRATQAQRQVGSNIKPFIYSAALDSGFSLASIVNDAPINQWDRRSGVAWRPKNSPEVYDGPIRLREALGKSKNVVSVRLLRSVGIRDTIDYLTNFGFVKDSLPKDESLSLGSASMTPLAVARGFATIENGGFLINPYVISHVEDANNQLLWRHVPDVACLKCMQIQNDDEQLEPEDIVKTTNTLGGNSDDNPLSGEEASTQDEAMPIANQTISEANAFLVKQMLKTAITGDGSWAKKTAWNGTGWRANNILKRKDLAGKTGTTNEAKDTWFSGMAGGIVATAWVGFDDNSRSLGRTSSHQYLINQNPTRYNWMGNAMVGGEDGARVAQPAWIKFMQQALQGREVTYEALPNDILSIRIDRASGKLTNRADYTTKFEYFIAGTEPNDYVKEGQGQSGSDTTQQAPEAEDSIF